MLKLYNTLTKRLESVTKKDHLNLYTCGPTVYNYAHIGNLRAFIMADLLYRTLKLDGYNPRWVMNITDIDDKTIKGTIAEYGNQATVQNLHDFTEKYLKIFRDDLKAVNVLVEEIEMIRVTDKMPEIQDFIIKLMDKGYAYKADDGIYFSIERYQADFGDYGQLVGEKFLEGKKIGARVAVDEYEKDNLSDFALWKAHNQETDGQIFWSHPVLGNGRPGWHIECSVINREAFHGEPTDIHTGGVDLAFPHHTNEIAQSQALLGKGNFVKHWFHSEHLLVDGKKMAKSANNFYKLADLPGEVKKKGLALRNFFEQSTYDIQQNFTLEAFRSALAAQDNMRKTFFEINNQANDASNLVAIQSRHRESFNRAIMSSLNTSSALGVLWDTLKDPDIAPQSKIMEVKVFDNVLALDTANISLVEPILEEKDAPESIKQLLTLRAVAKGQKDFRESDEIRKQIQSLGYEVMDTPEGQKLRKKSNN